MSYICALFLLHIEDTFSAFVCFANTICHPALMPFFILNEHQVQFIYKKSKIKLDRPQNISI